MQWVKETGMLYYKLDKGDFGFIQESNRYGNTYATILIFPKRLSRAKRQVYYYKLCVGDLKGSLGFTRLKDAKQFTEQTFKWMQELEDKEGNDHD